ncbi:MAG: pyrrolo-quinoline quinone [Alphaproteobacteria bacterium]|nr:pyrrolo-quinoline quinone [Alphaproteobacteria bacterium]
MKRIILAVAALSLLGGCGVFHKGKGKVTPTVGTRIAVLNTEASIEVDPTLASIPVTLPGALTNADWPQAGGNSAHSMGHLTLGATVGQAWRVAVGSGSNGKEQLAASPVFAAGRIFAMDTRAVVRAINPENGATIWETQVKGKDSSASAMFGGGVAFDNGRLYATNGVGDVAALDASNGSIIWLVRPGGPLRGAPTIANDNVYAVSQDNQLFALNPADGKVHWTGAGAIEGAGVLGAAAPAAAQGTVVAGFSSGELNAYRYEHGRVLWQDALSRTSISTVVTSLSDIDADPVIDSGRVYAIGQGGRMVALELVTGQRVWEINTAGIATPAVAGEWIFVVTDQAQLLCIARTTGKVRWLTQLRHYEKEKKKENPVDWVGPIVAGDRLILANSLGEIVNVSPADGSVQSTVETKMPVSLPPIVANNAMYILHDNGQMTAWR